MDNKEKDYSNLHRGLVLKYYWQVIRNFKISFFTVIFSLIIVSILDIYIPFQFLKLWNILSTNDFSLIEKARNVIIFIAVLKIISFGFRRLNEFSVFYFVANVGAELRKQAFSYMINHSKSFFANNFSGSLLNKINKYVRAFEKLDDRFVRNGIPLIIKTVGTAIAIYFLVPKYAIILFVFCIIFLLTALIYTKFKLKYDIISALADTKTNGALADSINNHSSIQFFTGHKYEEEKVGNVIEDQKRKTRFNWNLWGGLGAIQGFYIWGIEFIIFWIAIGDWKLGFISLPVIVLIQSYLFRLVENLWDFSSITKAYYEAFADAQEMALILNEPHEIKDLEKNKIENIKELNQSEKFIVQTFSDKVLGEIIFDDVTYIYDKNNIKVFDNFSLTIPSGEKVAIVGTSGAGKSTFVNLLMRLFNVTSGKILIDGVDISTVSQKKLREQIAFVPQDPVLFHRSLMDNIRYGRRDASDEEVKVASKLARCDIFIERLPEGYNTFVGERGVKLSGGERQRVAIARAILKNAPILILDEATSALDSESELLIQDALHNLIKDKTTIVIAHRLSTIRTMDRIIVIENGKIVEDDSHNQLVDKEDGIYKKLWDIQSGGFNDII